MADVSLEHICPFIVKHLVHIAARWVSIYCIEHYVHLFTLIILIIRYYLISLGLLLFLMQSYFFHIRSMFSCHPSAVQGSWRIVRWCESTNWRTTPQVYVLKLSDEIYDLKTGGQVFWKSYKRNNLKTRRHGIFEPIEVCASRLRGSMRGLADSTFNKLWKKELSVSH